MSQDVMTCVMNSTAVFDNVNVEMQSKESCVKCLNLNTELLNKQSAYNDLSKSYSQLEKHCMSLELTMQLNQEIFEKDSLSNNQNALEILEYFENNDLKAQLQAKNTTIYLKCQIQDKVFVIISLKNDLRKLKGKEVKNVAQIPIAITVAPDMFKLYLDPLALRLFQNRKAHTYYLKHTQEQADILQGIVEQAKAKQPLDNALNLACCPDCSLVSGLRMFKTYDKEPLSAHELYLEVAFRKKTCYIQNLEGVDLLLGSKDTNLHTVSLDDMLKNSLICLLSKLAKDALARGIPKLKFQKDHLCSACALGKSKKSSHQPKAEDTNQEKLHILHMDLCGPMRVESINGKKYMLVIVNDYLRFTWVRFLRSKDEAPDAIIKCIKNIQVHLNAIVRNVRTIRLFVISMKMSAFRIKLLLLVLLNRMALSKGKTELFSGPGLQSMTPATTSSGLVPNPIPQQPCNPPNRDDWDRLFQPMFDEYFNPPTIDVSPIPVAVTLRAVDTSESLVYTLIDIVIIECLVNISKRRAFWSLNEDILKINDSDYQYAISIKEDTAYPCLHSPKTTKETSSIRRIEDIDEVELTDEESSNNEDDVVEVFRIDTNIFDYETPLCLAFNKFNYLIIVDPYLLTKDIIGFKTYEDYKVDWIYGWNENVPWVYDKPWLDNGIWKEPTPVIGNSLHYQDLEWYEALEDCKLKEEALRNKANMEGLIEEDDDDDSCYEQRR
ncbi:retrovirus-related pol polyprotein from transposon TNT 1-94 [Tanacetum coccineum]